MPATVIVIGLAQIQRDLDKSGPAVGAAMREGMRQAAEPVAKLAENLSLAKIKRMRRSPEWAVTRIGVTRSAVYIAPKQRGVKSHNPFDPRRRGLNIAKGGLVTLMMGRSFEPALATMEPVVLGRVSRLLGQVLDA